jgi:GlpG protein
MRQIGTITDERQVQRLADYLLTLGIRIQVEPGERDFSVWAIDEDQVSQARDELQRFLENPGDERYAAAEREARRLRDELIRKEKQRDKNVIDVRRRWSMPRGRPLTILLIVISCLVGIATRFAENFDNNVARALLIADFRPGPNHMIHWMGLARSWPDDRTSPPRFQIWRLLTPIFLHLGPVHLAMNMLALHSLGTVIEARRGTWRLALMVLVIGIVSNLAQYAWSGPAFAGMSGVVCGLFGYAWMKSEFDHDVGIFMPASSVAMMLGFLVLCMTGLIGPIANAAHIGGLVVGVVLGYGPVLRRRIFGR